MQGMQDTVQHAPTGLQFFIRQAATQVKPKWPGQVTLRATRKDPAVRQQVQQAEERGWQTQQEVKQNHRRYTQGEECCHANTHWIGRKEGCHHLALSQATHSYLEDATGHGTTRLARLQPRHEATTLQTQHHALARLQHLCAVLSHRRFATRVVRVEHANDVTDGVLRCSWHQVHRGRLSQACDKRRAASFVASWEHLRHGHRLISGKELRDSLNDLGWA